MPSHLQMKAMYASIEQMLWDVTRPQDCLLQAERLTYLGVAIQGSTQMLVGSHTRSSAPLVNSSGPPSQPSLLHSGPDPSDNDPSDDEPQPPAVLPAAQQLADQMKVLLSGRLNQQCHNIQVGWHLLSCCCSMT